MGSLARLFCGATAKLVDQPGKAIRIIAVRAERTAGAQHATPLSFDRRAGRCQSFEFMSLCGFCLCKPQFQFRRTWRKKIKANCFRFIAREIESATRAWSVHVPIKWIGHEASLHCAHGSVNLLDAAGMELERRIRVAGRGWPGASRSAAKIVGNGYDRQNYSRCHRCWRNIH